MKLHFASCLHVLAVAASRGATEAFVYLSDLPSTSPDLRSLSPASARLIFAQSFGVSEYHSLHDADDDGLRALNDFGRGRQSMFSSERTTAKQRVMVVIDGVDQPQDVGLSIDGSRMPSFVVTDPPNADSNKKLVEDLAKQADLDPLRVVPDEEVVDWVYRARITYPTRLTYNLFSASNRSFIYSSTLKDVGDKRGKGSVDHRNTVAALKADVKVLFQQDWDITLVLIPDIFRSMFDTKPSWGAYSMPDTLRKRDESPPANTGAVLPVATKPANPQQQDPTDTRTTKKPARPTTTRIATQTKNKSTFVSTRSATLPTSAPTGILPQCYITQDACERVTHNCSGHGSCALKYDGPNNVADDPPCYACTCKPTRSEQGKTTHWAGPACQKKDVSVEFWLFAGFAIAMAALLSFTIGNLYQMGEQELPGVLGTGVTGLGGRGK